METSEIGIFLNKSWRPQLRDQTLCFSAYDTFFPAAATKGWALCKHDAELVECAAALRDLKLLTRSGCLAFPKGMAGMESSNKHVEQISFRLWVTFWEHGQLKGWQPHFQPTVAKSSISTQCNSMANRKNHIPIFRNKPWRPQPCDPTYASLHETQVQNLRQRDRIFCKHSASIMQSW